MVKCVNPAWVKTVQGVPYSPTNSLCMYILNKTTPESMCVSTTMILLKFSESVIRKWEIRAYPLVIHPVAYGLLKVSPDLCMHSYQKLTSETSKSNPVR